MKLTRLMKKVILVAFDATAIVFSGFIAYLFLIQYINPPKSFFYVTILLSIVSYVLLASYFKLFRKINRYTGLREIRSIFYCISIAFLFVAVVSGLTIENFSIRFIILTYLFTLLCISGGRIAWRIFYEFYVDKIAKKNPSRGLRTLMVGAGEGGSLFIKNLKPTNTHISIVGIVDNDPSKVGTILLGVPILGDVKQIPNIVEELKVDQITITIPSLKPKEYEQILDICNKADVPVNIMPSVEDVFQGKLSVSRFREIDVVDLLGREEVKLDMENISKAITDKVVLVTGAGGSIGSEISRQISRFSPKKIILLGHGENSIYQINRELNQLYAGQFEIIPVIADIQDRDRIFEVMSTYSPDYVYHAAAHKHVPMMEYNPREAVKNNVYGTKNVAEAAKFANVGNFVMVSTDKAVNPPNIMGATKRIAEMIVTGLNEPNKTKFAAVRFGNVLGSRGSVVPLFKEQIKDGGPVTVTDFRMTRYFMTIPEASRLVIQAGTLANGGEIFILDMGEPVKILDLAKKVVKLSGYTEAEIPIIETGIRPGEKLYEELLVDSEQTNKKVYDKIFVGKVTKHSLDDVMEFVSELDACDLNTMKSKLLAFANTD